MRELSLFSGAGGGLLATKWLLGWETIGYVEWDDYCQRVIAQRIRDGFLDDAPMFGDIRAFLSEGYARRYRGMVDVVTAGFPCQPFSVAGKRRGEDDPRNMWPATIATIREVRPRWALLENVPGLLAASHGYFGTVLRDLAESGYDARWRVLSAAELGAPHKRDRLWIFISYADHGAMYCGTQKEKVGRGRRIKCAVSMEGCNGPWSDKAIRFSVREGPRMGRIANGIPYLLDRLKAISNGQVPAVVAAAWHLLAGE